MATKTSRSSRSVRGDLTPQEIRPLAVTARKAFDYQQALGNVEHGDTFEAWRHRQVFEVTGKGGLTECHHADFRLLMARFQELAGLDAEAFDNLMTTGPATGDQDTHEERRVIAHQIVEAVSTHQAAGGPIGPGYILHIARQKTRRQRLTLGRDLAAGLSDRCTVAQLEQIRSTITNRIAAKEGRGDSRSRNTSQRAPRS